VKSGVKRGDKSSEKVVKRGGKSGEKSSEK